MRTFVFLCSDDFLQIHPSDCPLQDLPLFLRLNNLSRSVYVTFPLPTQSRVDSGFSHGLVSCLLDTSARCLSSSPVLTPLMPSDPAPLLFIREIDVLGRNDLSSLYSLALPRGTQHSGPKRRLWSQTACVCMAPHSQLSSPGQGTYTPYTVALHNR